MSHNQIKVGTAEPDASGVISPNLSEFGVSNVSDNEILGFTTSSGWGGVASPSIAKIVFASFQCGLSFTTSTADYDIGDCVIWRNAHMVIDDTTYTSRLTSAGTRVPAPSTNWTMSWRLKASTLQGRKIVCEAVHMAKQLSGTEDITYQWCVGTTSDLATYTPIGNKAQQTQEYCQTAYGHYEMGGSDMYIGMKVVDKNGVMGILIGATALNSYLTIGIQE